LNFAVENRGGRRALPNAIRRYGRLQICATNLRYRGLVTVKLTRLPAQRFLL
jgi:hypothetical protein